MINETYNDRLYLSGLLPERFPKFLELFVSALKENKIKCDFLPNTKDIWCRDYMPIQNAAGEFIQFRYEPDYLMQKKYRPLITNVDSVCYSLDIKTYKSDLIVDGGNIVHYGNNVVMCDKVLKENGEISKNDLIASLRQLLRVNHVLFIPSHPEDILGHSDGILRFIDQRTVIVSDFSKSDQSYWKLLTASLDKMKLNYIPVPCDTSKNKTLMDATGFYINFLQMKNILFLPAFGLMKDKNVEDQFKKLFPKSKIVSVNCGDLAKDGGVINCISWTIRLDCQKSKAMVLPCEGLVIKE